MNQQETKILFAKMQVRFGSRWAGQFPEGLIDLAVREWTSALKDFTLADAEAGLDAWSSDGVPHVNEFKRVCAEARRNKQAGYPTLHDVDVALAQVIEEVGRRPAGMPYSYADGAKWLRERVLDRMCPDEAPRKHNRGDAWNWPYLTRCIVHAREFLQMPANHQAAVLAAREDGVFWRGEPIEDLMRVHAEHQRMVDMGPDAYRKEAIKRLRELSVKSAA